jgi:hypothetical protein
MNRSSAIIFSLLFLLANGAYGFSCPCCCMMAVSSSMRCADEGSAIVDSSCNDENPCNDCGCNKLLSFRCGEKFKPLRFSAFESVRPASHIFALPVVVTDVPEFTQNFHSVHGRTHSFPLNFTDLFEKNCSFLS